MISLFSIKKTKKAQDEFQDKIFGIPVKSMIIKAGGTNLCSIFFDSRDPCDFGGGPPQSEAAPCGGTC